MHTIIYNYIESLDSESAGDVELFKHILCEQLGELNLTQAQLDCMADKSWVIDMSQRLEN